MGKRNRYRDSLDPECQRWGRTYPRFPGVEECVRQIRAGKARGTWAEMIAFELANNAGDHLVDLTAAFRDNVGAGDDVAMMALEIAELPASVDFLSQVLREGDQRFVPYARRTLQAINTRDSRKALFDASHGEQMASREPAVGSDSNGESPPPAG